MQSVSSSYQLDEPKIATSGNLVDRFNIDSGMEFSKFLEAFSSREEKLPQRKMQSDADKNFTPKSQRNDSFKKESLNISKVSRDNQSESSIEAKKQPVQERNEYLPQDHQPKGEKDVSLNNDEMSGRERFTDKETTLDSTHKETTLDSTHKDNSNILSSSDFVEKESAQFNNENSSVVDVHCASDEFTEISICPSVKNQTEGMPLTDRQNISEDSLDPSNNFTKENLVIFSEISRIASENDIDLQAVDSNTLNNLVYKMSYLYSDFESSELEAAAVKFLKGDSGAFNQFEILNPISSPVTTDEMDVMSMLSELNGDIKIKGDKSQFNIREDFGAKDFEVIEDSIKATITLDEILAKEDIETKIDSIMIGKKDSLKGALENSVAVLQKAVNLSKGQINNPQENMLSQNHDAVLNNRISLGEALQSNLSGSSHSNSGSYENNSMLNHLQFAQIHSSNSGSKAASNFNLSMADAQKLDLLNMSSDLKENARALAEKVMEMSSRNLKSLDLTLNPEGLGKMRIVIDAASADEITRVSISASHSGTRAMLESGIDVLKNLLESNQIFAKTEVSEYSEESDLYGQNQDESSKNFNQDSSHNKENEQNQSDNGTLFAGGKIDAEASENHHIDENENINISQNSNTVSYFA